jgi:hypothetical protein
VIKVIPKQTLTSAQIAALRKISTLGISEIQSAARLRGSVRDVALFGSDWDEERIFLYELWRSYSFSNAPFDIYEQSRYGKLEHLSPVQLEARLRHYREIELDQQMQSDLERGFIGSHDEFVPHDEEWLSSGAGP